MSCHALLEAAINDWVSKEYAHVYMHVNLQGHTLKGLEA